MPQYPSSFPGMFTGRGQDGETDQMALFCQIVLDTSDSFPYPRLTQKQLLISLFAPAREAGIASMVRIPEPRREVFLKFMEMGAAEIPFPQTEPVEQAEALVDCAMYALFGNRGVSFLRAPTRYEKIREKVRFVYASIGGQ